MSSSSSSFFPTTGASPPPLTPNGLLSGLHSFLFSDSVNGLVDTFVVDSMTGVSVVDGLSTTNVVGGGQTNGVESPNGYSASTNGGTNTPATASSLRLPPFCSI